MLVQMELASFGIDPSKNCPVLVLKESGGQRTLAVPVGPFEASAIAVNSLGVDAEKPQSVDLTRVVMESLGGSLERALLAEGAGDGGLAASLHVVRGRSVYLIECSASHAIMLAMRCDAPIFIVDSFLEKRQGTTGPSPADVLRRHIASVDTVDFGKYYLE